MSPVQTTPRPLVMLTVCFLAVGLWQIGEGSWIYAKARLAQVLLQRAWSQTLAGHMQVKPWPWADTWPVGRLRVPSEEIDVIVLNGALWPDLGLWPRRLRNPVHCRVLAAPPCSPAIGTRISLSWGA